MRELDEAVTESREVALGLVLQAWRTRRDPRIAQVIDALSAQIARPRPAGKKPQEKEAAWHALADKRDPADVGVLLATLTDTRQGNALFDRVMKLGSFDADPRIADALTALIRLPGEFGHVVVSNICSRALKIICAIADPRSREAFAALAALDDLRIRDALATCTLSPAPVVPLDADELAVLARIAPAREPVRAVDLDALYAAVYANPDDDAPRSVLADVLQERGDPRGELIALQLARAAGGKRTKRERELLDGHLTEWLGELAKELQASVAFERGFLARCAVRTSAVAQELFAQPMMSTVVALDVKAWRFMPRLEGKLPALRSVRGVDAKHVAVLRPEDLRALRHLALVEVWGAQLDAICAAPIVAQLEELELDFELDSLEAQIARLLALPIRVVAKGDVGSWDTELRGRTYIARWARGADIAAMVATLEALPADALDGVTLHMRGREETPPALVEAAARFRAYTIEP